MRHNDSWLQAHKNEAIREVRVGNRFINSIRFSSNETLNHFMLKCKLCYQLAQEEKEFITEAIFEKGGRADILVLDDHVIIEALETETLDEVTSKTSSYPSIFSIEFARFKDNEIERGVVRHG